MPKLVQSLHDWQSAAFLQTLKDEIGRLEPGSLPLQAGVSQGGYADDGNITATVLSAVEDEKAIHVRAGIFFTEIVGSCGCGAEPMAQNAYCEIRISIDKASAEARFTLLRD